GHVGFHLQRRVLGGGGHGEHVPCPVDPRHGGAESHVNTECPRARNEDIDQVRIECVQRARAMVDDGYLGAGTGGNVPELEGDVPAAYEQHGGRKNVELKKLLARDEMLAALKAEVRWLRACRNQDVTPLEHVIPNVDRGRSLEVGSPVEGRDACPRKSVLPLPGHGLDHCSLEPHQLWPFHAQGIGAYALCV